jgi:hypothetical protein
MTTAEQHAPADRQALLWAVSQGAVVAMMVVALFWLLLIGAASLSGGSGAARGDSMTMCNRD